MCISNFGFREEKAKLVLLTQFFKHFLVFQTWDRAIRYLKGLR